MARVTAENAGPSYASVLNFRTDNSDSNKENIEDSTEVASEAKVEEEEGFVPVLGHGRRPGKGRRERERRPPPRTHKPAPHAEQPSQSQDQPQQPPDAPKKFVEAPIPKVNPWQTVIFTLPPILWPFRPAPARASVHGRRSTSSLSAVNAPRRLSIGRYASNSIRRDRRLDACAGAGVLRLCVKLFVFERRRFRRRMIVMDVFGAKLSVSLSAASTRCRVGRPSVRRPARVRSQCRETVVFTIRQ